VRFSERNQDLIQIFQLFDYKSPNYFNSEYLQLSTFLKHYKYFQIDSLKISTEFTSAKSLFKHKNILSPDHDTIINTLKELPEAFSETLKIIQIIFTLPVSTASNERFFSSLKKVKSYIRSTIGDDRLNDLMVISVEKEEADKIDLNEAVNLFANMKNRRYKLF